jgi:hypothetical protein
MFHALRIGGSGLSRCPFGLFEQEESLGLVEEAITSEGWRSVAAFRKICVLIDDLKRRPESGR